MLAVLAYLWSSWPFKKTYKNQWFFNISAFGPHQAPTYSHHTYHLLSFGSIFYFPTTFFQEFSENVIPACTGSIILKIGLKHFYRKILLFWRRNGPTWACFGHVFQPYRSAVQSFPLLSPPCPPSWTSKILANMCIIATGGFLGRLEPCIRHHFDDIFMYATLCWWHFDVSDMVLIAFSTFGLHFFCLLAWFFWKCASCLSRNHNSRYRHKAFKIKNLTFSTSALPRYAYFSYDFRPYRPLGPSKKAFKTDTFSTFSLFGPTKPPHIGIKFAIERFSDPIFIFGRSFSFFL